MPDSSATSAAGDGSRKVAQLDVNQATRLARKDKQVIRVVTGQAWVTVDGQDIFLEPGDELPLQAGKDEVVLTCIGVCPLVYEVS